MKSAGESYSPRRKAQSSEKRVEDVYGWLQVYLMSPYVSPTAGLTSFHTDRSRCRQSFGCEDLARVGGRCNKTAQAISPKIWVYPNISGLGLSRSFTTTVRRRRLCWIVSDSCLQHKTMLTVPFLIAFSKVCIEMRQLGVHESRMPTRPQIENMLVSVRRQSRLHRDPFIALDLIAKNNPKHVLVSMIRLLAWRRLVT